MYTNIFCICLSFLLFSLGRPHVNQPLVLLGLSYSLSKFLNEVFTYFTCLLYLSHCVTLLFPFVALRSHCFLTLLFVSLSFPSVPFRSFTLPSVSFVSLCFSCFLTPPLSPFNSLFFPQLLFASLHYAVIIFLSHVPLSFSLYFLSFPSLLFASLRLSWPPWA